MVQQWNGHLIHFTGKGRTEEVWFYCNHALVRQIHGLHKSKLHALCTVPFHRLRRQSMDCNATQGSILCAAQSMDCTKAMLWIHHTLHVHDASSTNKLLRSVSKAFLTKKVQELLAWNTFLCAMGKFRFYHVTWIGYKVHVEHINLCTEFIVVGNLVVTFILRTCWTSSKHPLCLELK